VRKRIVEKRETRRDSGKLKVTPAVFRSRVSLLVSRFSTIHFLLSALCFLLCPTLQAADITWTKQTPSTLWPKEVAWLVLPYDPVSQQTLLYIGPPSGGASIYSTDFYVYKAQTNTFTHLMGTGSAVDSCPADQPTLPGDRHPWEMVTDTKRNYIWLFGGVNVNCGNATGPQGNPRQDLYYLTLNADPLTDVWHPLTPAHQPDNIAWSGIAYDSDDDVLFLWGGTSGGQPHDWVYCSTIQNPTPGILTAKQSAAGCSVNGPDDWSQVPVVGAQPPGAMYASLLYDTVTHKAINFGGMDSSLTITYNQTWAYDVPTKTWTQKCQTNCTPPPAETTWTNQASWAYNSATHKIIYHQSLGVGGPADWQFDPAANSGDGIWTKLVSAGGPSQLVMAGYDPAVNAIVTMDEDANNQLEMWQGSLVPSCTIAPTALTSGVIGNAYAQTLTTSNCGLGPFTWTITSGSLPPGLSGCSNFSGPSCSITGTPTSASGSPFTFTIQSTDGGSNTTTQSFSLTITAPDTTPPSVSIVSPISGAVVSGAVTFSANASDNVGVAGVQFKFDGSNLGSEVTTAPYTMSWNTAGGSDGGHVLTAVARDAAGNTTTSAQILVTVNNSGTSVHPVSPSDPWCSIVNAALPGQTILFAAGSYPTTCSISVSGTAGSPITLRSASAAPSDQAVFSYSGTTSNILDVSGSYLQIRWFGFGPTAAGAGVNPIKLHNSASNLVIDQNVFNNTDIAVPANDSGSTYQNISVTNNVLKNMQSTGLYFGCHDGTSCHALNILIQGNLIDTIAPGDQVGYGLEVKLNSYATIKDNTIYRSRGPGLMVYGSNRGDPASVIEGNYVEGAVTDAGINVGGGPAIVRNNVVVGNNPGIWAQDYNGRGLQQNVWIVNNTALNNQSDGIEVQNWQANAGNVLAYNAITPLNGTPALSPASPAGIVQGNSICNTAGVCFDQPAAAPYDLWPAVGGPLIGAAGSGSESWRVTDDFMCQARGSATDAGALQRTGSGTGPLLGNGNPRPACGSSGTTPPSTPPGSNPPTTTVAPTTLNVRVYPNPWRSDKHSGHNITFDGLAPTTTINLFTVSGHKIKEISTNQTKLNWDLTNDSGDKVASGVYLYVITDSAGNKVKGKVAVIK